RSSGPMLATLFLVVRNPSTTASPILSTTTTILSSNRDEVGHHDEAVHTGTCSSRARDRDNRGCTWRLLWRQLRRCHLKRRLCQPAGDPARRTFPQRHPCAGAGRPPDGAAGQELVRRSARQGCQDRVVRL